MSIGQRISTLMVLAVAACMVLFATYNIRARRAELVGEALLDASEVGATLDVVLNEILSHRELTELEQLPEEIAQARRIYGLAIFDLGSGVVVGSRSTLEHRPFLRSLAETATRTGRPISREVDLAGTHSAAYAFPLRRGRHDVVGAGVVLRNLGYMDSMLRQSRERVISVGILLCVMVVVLVFGVTRRTVEAPVKLLIDGVRRIGEGNLLEPINVERRDEIGRIAAALNKMMTDLSRARLEGRRELETRVALEKSVDLERRLQHAQRLAAVGQIAASLAHEIGSPLHVVSGRARFAAGRDDPGEMRENLLVIATQADRITRVVEQLLSVARRRAPRFETVDLGTVARGVVSLLSTQARLQKVRLEITGSLSGVHTTGDPDSLQQVIFNLVLNAVQVQPQGGYVSVHLESAAEHDSLGSERITSVVEVRDSGPGVPIEKREAIFEPFATSREGGTGLGLAVVRGIVREHAGTIKVHDNPGGGAVFRVCFPSIEEQ